MPVKLVVAQFADQVNWRFISQLIKDISRVLQKLIKYFNVATISTFFVLPSAGVLSVILALNLNDSEFAKFHLECLCDTVINVLMFINEGYK